MDFSSRICGSKLFELIEKKYVNGWDDPRMPTISGLRKRGYTPESLIKFVELVGVAKRENLIDFSLLEFSVREHLNLISPRVMAVLNPVRLIIKNYPENQDEILEGEINPEKPELGKRKIPFSKELYIEKEDFKEEANRKFYRLSIGKEVRLKNAYIIKAETVMKNNDGTIKEIICSYDPKSKSGSGSEESKRKVKGTIHWVTIKHSLNVDVNIYTSPHIQNINERFVFNNKEISDDNLVKLLVEVEEVNDGESITYFEILTVAFFYYAKNFDNINLIESGLFHRFDATNIISKNLASVITAIGLDHLDWLPKNEQTLEKIIHEKTSSLLSSKIIIGKQTDNETLDMIKENISSNNSKKWIQFTRKIHSIY